MKGGRRSRKSQKSARSRHNRSLQSLDLVLQLSAATLPAPVHCAADYPCSTCPHPYQRPGRRGRRVGHASVELLPGAAAGLTASALQFPPQRFAPDASCPMGYFCWGSPLVARRTLSHRRERASHPSFKAGPSTCQPRNRTTRDPHPCQPMRVKVKRRC